jgi:hypothetical protein
MILQLAATGLVFKTLLQIFPFAWNISSEAIVLPNQHHQLESFSNIVGPTTLRKENAKLSY